MKEIIKDLDNGLILRKGTIEDAEALVNLHAQVQGEGEWTQMLVSGNHPNTGVENFIVVEDINKNILVSSVCYIPQTWTYGKVEFGVWRIEMVSTLKEYRDYGLVREQINYIHKLSDSSGIYIDVIVGRPWFYRKFGYDMALRYWKTHYISKHAIKIFEEKDSEVYKVRIVGEEGIPYCTNIFNKMKERYSVTCVREEKNWNYDAIGQDGESILKLAVIEDMEGASVGAICYETALDDSFVSIDLCELDENVSWLEITPCLLKYFIKLGEEFAAKEKTELRGLIFSLRDGHPIYKILAETMKYSINSEAPLAWYVRVGDVAAFIKHVAPVLEERISNSFITGYTGTLKINFYSIGCGLVFSFEKGKLVSAENESISQQEVAFPIEYFKQLIFGYKSLDELRSFSPEIQVTNEARIVLDVLFPKHESYIFSIC